MLEGSGRYVKLCGKKKEKNFRKTLISKSTSHSSVNTSRSSISSDLYKLKIIRTGVCYFDRMCRMLRKTLINFEACMVIRRDEQKQRQKKKKCQVNTSFQDVPYSRASCFVSILRVTFKRIKKNKKSDRLSPISARYAVRRRRRSVLVKISKKLSDKCSPEDQSNSSNMQFFVPRLQVTRSYSSCIT